MPEWTIGAVLDAIADAVPDRPMTVCGERVSTYAESADRTEDHGLAVDGIAGPRTLEGMRLATPGNRLWRWLIARLSILAPSSGWIPAIFRIPPR